MRDRTHLWAFAGAVLAAVIGAVATIAAAGGGPRASDPVVSYDDSRIPAAITNVRVEHGVEENGVKGMRLHARVSTAGRKGVMQEVTALFSDSSGVPLRDGNGRFQTTDGAVAVWSSFVPEYNEANATDVTLFFPLTEFELAPGRHPLRVEVVVYDRSLSAVTARSEPVHFVYTEDLPAATATVSNVWVEPSVVEGGVSGLRVHATVTVQNRQGTEILVGAYFYQGDTPMRDYDGTCGGECVVFASDTETPMYADTRFDDFVLFLPDADMHASGGEYSLQTRVIVKDLTGTEYLAVSEPAAFRKTY